MTDVKRFLRAEWDRVAGYGCVAAGLVLLVAGFVGVRTSADVIDEISYLVTGGIGSIFLLGVGATMLLSADLHDDFRKLHRVEEKLDRVERLLRAQHPEVLAVDDPPSSGGPAGADRRAMASAVPVGAAEADGEPADNAVAGVGQPALAVGDRGMLAVRRGRLFAAVGIAVAAVLFGAGALRTSHQASTDHMAGSVGLALGGALLVAFVAALMVAQLRATVEQRKVAVLGPWLTGTATDRADAAFTAVDAPTRSAGEGVFVVAGLPFYHRAGCQLLADRPVTEVDRAALGPATAPCRLCEPA